MRVGRRGRKRRLGVEDEYWRLIAAGIGPVQACRQVGIGRKTGYRWRAERGGLPPARQRDGEDSGRYLGWLDRQRIATMRERGLGVREIARRLDRSPSTISRELKRNTLPHDRGHYDADLADARARERRHQPRRSRIAGDPQLKEAVQAKLELEWSPGQIAGWLREEFPNRTAWHVCHETIYQALYHGGRGGLSRCLTKKLRTGRPLRKRRRSPAARTPRFIAPGKLIHARSELALTRSRIGNWEGDLITGRNNRSAIGTLVCRHSRLTKLVHLPDGRTAEQLRDAIRRTLSTLPVQARQSLVWDQGSEMAYHDQIADLFVDGVFFAEPGKPWQRPTNENSNGLLRQYFPKRGDLSMFSQADLRAIEDRINNRPRKTLGWRSPSQVFAAALALRPATVLRP